MDQLRRDFEVYRDEVDERVRGAEGVALALPAYSNEGQEIGIRRVEDGGDELGERIQGTDHWTHTGSPTGPHPGPHEGSYGAPPPAPAPEPGAVVFSPGMTMDAMEEQAIRATLLQTGGNRRRAAEILGIGERTLYRKIRRYEIED
jgi:transcriptional regulator of acetoin/glycerol metabolism